MLQTATYGEFSTQIHKRQMGRRAPVEVSIEVTHRCPLECQHCYNNLPMHDPQARRLEMTFEEHIRLLDELVEMEELVGAAVFLASDAASFIATGQLEFLAVDGGFLASGVNQ